MKVDRIISILFLLSGLTGLVYQVLWAKYLGSILGNTAHAHTIVLATFLGGLAIGNAIIGPYADRVKEHIRLYGWLEIGIGVIGAFSPYLFTLFSEIYINLARNSISSPFISTVLRLTLSSVTILVPTILMGGTLPILTKYVTRSLGEMEKKVAWLYFLNSGGAALGALSAGFFLIPLFDLDLSITLAAGLNIIIGLVSIVIARVAPLPVRTSKKLSLSGEDFAVSSAVDISKAKIYFIYVAVFISGVVSLTYEVVWIRLLSLILGSSTYSFSIMLAAFIAGIALGSFIIQTRGNNGRSPYLMFGLAELGIFASIVITLPIYERLPFMFLNWRGVIVNSPDNFFIYESLKFVFCFFLTLLPTTFLGMTLPLASRAVTSSINEIGKGVGSIFSFNTIGNVSGAILAGLWLMPIIGIEDLIRIGMFLNAALGVAIVLSATESSPRFRVMIAGACTLLLIFQSQFIPSWDKKMMSVGVFRREPLPPALSFKDFKRGFKNQDLLFYKDDSSATVTVVKYATDNLVLRVNGKPDASTGDDMSTQALLGHLPLFVSPESKRGLVVGLGSGVTAASALRHPIEKLDVVEISGAVAEAAELFAPWNNNVLTDPRLNLAIEDAITFLKLSNESYDFVISEPSNPWIAGIGNLFTVEFYEEVVKHLAPGGVMAQWFHTYEMDDFLVALVLRSFMEVFPHVTIWNSISNDTGDGDFILIGSLEKLSPDPEKMLARFGIPLVKEDLSKIKINYLATLLSIQSSTEEQSAKISGAGLVNRERFPILEYEAPKAFFVSQGSKLLSNNDLRLRPSDSENSLFSRTYPNGGEALESLKFRDLLAFNERFGSQTLSQKLVIAWNLYHPLEFEPAWILTNFEKDQGKARLAKLRVSDLLSRFPDNYPLLMLAAEVEFALFKEENSYLTSTTPDSVLGFLQRAIEINPSARGEIESRAFYYLTSFGLGGQALKRFEDTYPLLSDSDRVLILPKIVEYAIWAGDKPSCDRYLSLLKTIDAGAASKYNC